MKKTLKRVLTLTLATSLALSAGITSFAAEDNLLISPAPVSAPVYDDSTELGKADILNELGLFNGTDNGYELEREATRLEALIMMIRMMGNDYDALTSQAENPFTDSPTWEGASNYIAYGYEQNLTSGVTATTFDPNSPASCATYATFMLRALGYTDTAEATVWDNWETLAEEAGLLTDVSKEDFTRGDAVTMSYNALDSMIFGTEMTLREKLIEDLAINGFSDAKIQVALGEEVTLESNLELVAAKVYQGGPADYSQMHMGATKLTAENMQGFIGINDLDIVDGIAIEPMMSAQAHSVVILEVAEGVDVEQAKKDIAENVDPRKWICVGVEPENVRVESTGNFIILIMDNFAPDDFVTAFKSIPVNKQGLIYLDGNYIEMGGHIPDTQINFFTNKLISLDETYFENAGNIYYSIIPDKNYYVRDQINNYYDHEVITDNIASKVPETFTEIDIAETLNFDNYYLTDSHWKQEDLLSTVNVLADAMGVTIDTTNFTETTLDGFIGHYGNLIDGLKPESLIYLENDFTKNAIVSNFADENIKTVYDVNGFSGLTPYDIYLSGATPITTIENPNATSVKELVIFRDSFASAITPLLLEPYAKVTLVDLRYMSSTILNDYVDFNGADVLFLYSARLVDSANILR